MPTSLRRDAETEHDRPVAAGEGPYALVADLIGIAEGAPPDLARQHTAVYRERLRESRTR